MDHEENLPTWQSLIDEATDNLHLARNAKDQVSALIFLRSALEDLNRAEEVLQ